MGRSATRSAQWRGCVARVRGSSLTGFELFVVVEFPKSGNLESPHLEYLDIPCVLGQILEKIASGM